MRKYLNLRANIALGLIFAFLLNSFGPMPSAQAQEFSLPAPGVMVPLSAVFNPPLLKGIKVHSDNPFRFDFILDQGDHPVVDPSSKKAGPLPGGEEVRRESTKLIKYFLASLTIPENDLWVNLSPYKKNRIIPQSFGLTEMGRDLLAEDYMLKQITASLIYPEGETGRRFWKRIYKEAYKEFGTTDIPVNTFNKVWIIPEKAVVYENAKAGTAYVVESKLKVMLEQDYLALSHSVMPRNDTSTIGANIVREIVIPQLTKEVNEGKNFVQLRQVYNSLILATWYKKKIKDSILTQVYADKNRIKGLSSPNVFFGDPQYIYQQYLKAFKKGVYNYIKEEPDHMTNQTIPRKYFSGGVTFFKDLAMATTIDSAVLPTSNGRSFIVRSDFAMANNSSIDFNEEIQGWVEDSNKEILVTANDGAVFKFVHRQEKVSDQTRHRIDVYLNRIKIGHIHFVINKFLIETIASMHEAFPAYRGDSLKAIYVAPKFTSAFKGSYKGIGRSLLGLAERLAFLEGAKRFYAMGVNRDNFTNFYQKFGYGDPNLSLVYGFTRTVIKELNVTSFSKIAIERSPAQLAIEHSEDRAMRGDVKFDPRKGHAVYKDSIRRSAEAAEDFAARLKVRKIEDESHVRYDVIAKSGTLVKVYLRRETDGKRFWDDADPMMYFKVDPADNLSAVNITIVKKHLKDGNELAGRGLAKQLYQLLWKTMSDGAGIEELLTNPESLNFLREHCQVNEEGIFFEELPGSKPLRIVEQGPVIEGQITLEDVLTKTLMGHLLKQASFVNIRFSFKRNQGDVSRIYGEDALRKFLGENSEKALSHDTPAFYLDAEKSRNNAQLAEKKRADQAMQGVDLLFLHQLLGIARAIVRILWGRKGFNL